MNCVYFGIRAYFGDEGDAEDKLVGSGSTRQPVVKAEPEAEGNRMRSPRHSSGWWDIGEGSADSSRTRPNAKRDVWTPQKRRRSRGEVCGQAFASPPSSWGPRAREEQAAPEQSRERERLQCAATEADERHRCLTTRRVVSRRD